MGSLFPPLPPDALVFTPGPAEFMAIAEELLGPAGPELDQIDQEQQQMVSSFVLSVGSVAVLAPILDETNHPADELQEDVETAPLLELLATLAAGDSDVDELVGVAGLIPDEGTGPQPPPPGAGDPEIPPTPTPPPQEGGAACVTFTITNCLAGGCGTFCACATDEGTLILPVGPGGECG
ncbi:MAG: hypothetical protein ACRD2K_06110 [Terriglobales bacterium]